MTTNRRIGLVVPFDLALDREYWQFVPQDVSLHISRTDYVDGKVNLEITAAVSDPAQVARATRSIVKVEPAVVAYACTSGSFHAGLAGERALREVILTAGAPKAITTSGALLAALAALGVRRVAVGTPYVEEVAARLPAFLREGGYEPVSLVNMDLSDGIWELAAAEVTRLAEAAMTPEADALFLSCTNLPTIELIGPLETRLGVPVLTANQVTMWAALRAIESPPAEGVAGQALFAQTAPRPVG